MVDKLGGLGFTLQSLKEQEKQGVGERWHNSQAGPMAEVGSEGGGAVHSWVVGLGWQGMGNEGFMQRCCQEEQASVALASSN